MSTATQSATATGTNSGSTPADTTLFSNVFHLVSRDGYVCMCMCQRGRSMISSRAVARVRADAHIGSPHIRAPASCHSAPRVGRHVCVHVCCLCCVLYVVGVLCAVCMCLCLCCVLYACCVSAVAVVCCCFVLA